MEDLDILRAEMTQLKQNLDKERIVSEKLLRTVMDQKVSWINNFVKWEFVLVPIVFLVIVGICAFFHISQLFAVSFLVLAVIDAFIDLRTFRIPPKIFSTCSMMEVRRRLNRQKKERLIHMCVALPLAVVWIILLLNAIATASDPTATDHAVNLGGVIGGIIGGVIGGIVVIVIYRRAQRTNDQLIEMNNE